MMKKLYSLFSVLLLLASCATEEIEQIEIQPTDGATVSLSFSVDAPNALEITKATGGDVDKDKGVESLYLYTFNENGEFISPVVEAEASGDGYTASISKETRTIHFVANDGTLVPSQESGMVSLTTGKQIFWGKRTFRDVPAKNISNSLEANGSSDVELLRNWAKITLNLSTEAAAKLKDVSYFIYNESKSASIGYNEAGKLNVPAQDFYAPTEESEVTEYTAAGDSVYTFEHNNQDKNGAFVIVKARFDGSADYTYYKIDLAVKDESNKVTRVYDIVRNYAFKIEIKSVSRKGATWAEVIDGNTIADNNITASAIMEKYPNITYGGEALNVTKTTFVFTRSSNNALSMTATYAGTGQLSVVPDEGMSDVVEGGLSIAQVNQTITITANLKSAPASGEKVAYFYVIGGNLQRRIKLVLRPPYHFMNPRFEGQDGSNKIGAGLGQDVYLRFSVPEDVEASLYPIEYKIYTKKLYAVEDGVRLEATGNGDWCYVYTDQVPSTAERVIHFKTNTEADGESDVRLDADLFNSGENLAYTRSDITDTKVTFAGTYKYPMTNKPGGALTGITGDISVACLGYAGYIHVVNGKFSGDPISIPGNIKEITLSFTGTYYYYSQKFSIDELTNDDLKVLSINGIK